MKKNLFLAAAAVAMLASCSQNDLEAPVVAEAQQTAIEFGTYLGKTPASRAGLAGPMNDTQLRLADASGGGFGLFAYHTDNDVYSSSAKPDFMWNQGVFYNDGTSKWEYTPVKYWPNETSTTNNEQQGSYSAAGIDRVTFFAYAPYVTAAEVAADNTKGITAISPNNQAGDPKISYTVATDQDDAVDLLWGVIPDTNTEWPNVTGTPMTSATNPAFNTGFPYLDLLKPEKDQLVELSFRHALAKLTVGVQVVNDQVDPTSSTLDNVNTKIFIKSITITSKTTDGFGTSGVLNLNNNTSKVPRWESPVSNLPTVLTADESGEIADALFWADPTDESTRTTQFAKTGATQALLNIASGATPATTDTGWMVVPTNTKNDFTVNIDYFVMTKDENLELGYSIVENNIKKDVSVAAPGFVGGLNYQIKLLLGLTSVKVNASVFDWADGEEVEVDLPMNVD